MDLKFFAYLGVMAGVTYLVRMLPLVLVKEKITNPFLLSFLYYIPYSVLSVMTVPAIFHATEEPVAAILGFLTAVLLAWRKKGLLTVALSSCAVALMVELLLKQL